MGSTSTKEKSELIENYLKITKHLTYKCDVCKHKRKIKNKISTCRCGTHHIIIPINISQFSATLNSESFVIVTSYTYSTTIKDLINKASLVINRKFRPQSYYIYYIKKESFCGGNIHESKKDKWNLLCSKSITTYQITDIIQVGLEIYVSNAFRHIVNTNDNIITCQHIKQYKHKQIELNESFLCRDLCENDVPKFVMWCKQNEYDSDAIQDDFNIFNDVNKSQSNIYQYVNDINKYQKIKQIFDKYNNNVELAPLNLALKCPIYNAVKTKHEWSEDYWKHLYEFTHFIDAFRQKPKCKYHQKCNAFNRLCRGGNLLKDKCHNRIYSHPPRSDREIKMEGMNSLIINTNKQQNHAIYKPTDEDKKRYKYNEEDGFINALIEEVIKNGYKYDLCMNTCCTSDNNNCKCKDYPSLLYIIDEKIECFRHKQMGKPLRRDHMLSLYIYTSCDCNYELCKSQRNGNYNKWKWFDHILYKAICRLSIKEKGCYKLYSGLNAIKLNKNEISNGYFVTYVSTTWKKSVAMNFMKGMGMIIEFDEQFRDNNKTQCCDVSWISKFGMNECEVLIARSVSYLYNNHFTLSILDENDEIQTVLLKKKDKKKSKHQSQDAKI